MSLFDQKRPDSDEISFEQRGVFDSYFKPMSHSLSHYQKTTILKVLKTTKAVKLKSS